LLRDEAGLKSDLENPEACLSLKKAFSVMIHNMIIAPAILALSLL
jgi:hypothetical protein